MRQKKGSQAWREFLSKDKNDQETHANVLLHWGRGHHMCPSKIYFLFYIGKNVILLANWSPRIKAFSSLQSRWLCPSSLINGKLPEAFLNGG